MPTEPAEKRTVVFFDGQNLFHAVKKAFGYTYPNYDAAKLANAVCSAKDWELRQVRFYTGIPSAQDHPAWHKFWTSKLLTMSRGGIHVYSRPLRYRNKVGAGGTPVLVGEEKGIDVRIAIDVLSCAMRGDCDVAVLFSQDQDLSEVADEVRVIAQEQDRWLKIVSAFPVSAASSNRRGINKTDWIKIDRTTYDTCLDPWDYRNDTAAQEPHN
jgi:uncharacterized LabA/DUF88 family protein